MVPELDPSQPSVILGTSSEYAMRRNTDSSADNAVDAVVRELRRMIFDGELQAMQALRQEDLAARLGTSRHPVREALGRLTGEGLVTFRPRHGYTVTVLGPEEITEIFEMRMVLEEHAGYLATLKRTDTDIDAVEERLLKMQPLHRRSAANMALWSTYNREFHARLFAASGRRHLCRTIGVLREFDRILYSRDGCRHRPGGRLGDASGDFRKFPRRRRSPRGAALPTSRPALRARADGAAARPARFRERDANCALVASAAQASHCHPSG